MQAREKATQQGLGSLKLVEGDLESITYDEAFDTILMSAALPYLQDIPAALARFRSWLKPGGRFLCNTPQVGHQPY